MTKQELEILQLARRIQNLSLDPRHAESMPFRLGKIHELVNEMIPRLQDYYLDQEDIPA